MLTKDAKYRKRLSTKQLSLLSLICKFRFATVPLLSEWRQKDASTLYEALYVLRDQGYLLKRYDSSYRLRRKAATYSLSRAGVTLVAEHFSDHFTPSGLRKQYKNKYASDQLVEHSLDIVRTCIQLRAIYGPQVSCMSAAEMTIHGDTFITPHPDLYVYFKNMPQHYLLELIPAGTFTWILRKRINAHQDWIDDHEEGYQFSGDEPNILFVCENDSTERRIHRLSDQSLFDFEVYTTTTARLESKTPNIWMHYHEEDEPLISL